MGKKKNSLLQGTVDLLILSSLRTEDRHAWGIQQRVERLESHVLSLKQGSLYPALTRLGDEGLIRPEWRMTENGRRAKYYGLTSAGRERLAAEIAQWRAFSSDLNLLIESA